MRFPRPQKTRIYVIRKNKKQHSRLEKIGQPAPLAPCKEMQRAIIFWLISDYDWLQK